MIKVFSRGILTLFLAIFISIPNSLAQIQTTSYNNQTIKENSIVVKYDNNVISVNGKAIAPQALVSDVRTQFSASINQRIDKQNIEEWKITGNMDQILSRLNSLPGVKAFPNYIITREELDTKPVEIVGNNRIKSKPIRRLIESSKASANRSVNKTARNIDLNISPLALDDPLNERPAITISNVNDITVPIYSDDLNDATRVEDSWRQVEFSGNGIDTWRLIEDTPGDSIFYSGPPENPTYQPNANTVAYSPFLNLSLIDTTKDYKLVFEHADDLEGVVFDNLILYLGVGSAPSLENFDITKSDGILYTSELDISNYAGLDSVWFAFQMTSDGDIQQGFGALFDDIEIYETTPPVTNDFLLSEQYALQNLGTFDIGYSVPDADMDVFEAWEITTGSDDVIMVVFDDGVDINHPDLADNIWVNPGEDLNNDGIITENEIDGIDNDMNGYVDDFYGWSPVNDDNSFFNEGANHGTYVAGILGAQGDNGIGISGVSQDVSIISVMLFDEFGTTDFLSLMKGYQYISDLLSNGVDITGVNQSFGGFGFFDYESHQQAIEVITDYALEHSGYGTAWIVAAGNNGSDLDELPYYTYPGNIQSPNIITVASSDDADQKSEFSDYGVFTVDVTAPGEFIVTTQPSNLDFEYTYVSGTSMAAPQVSGIIALLKSHFPNETGVDLMTRVLVGNEDVAALDGFTGEGGRVNALGAFDPTTVGNVTDLASVERVHFHKTFLDGDALETIGFVNTTQNNLTISSANLVGLQAPYFIEFFPTPINQVLAPGELYTFELGFNNGITNLSQDVAATLVVNTLENTALNIDVRGRLQSFPSPSIDPEIAELGSVPYGDEITASFTLTNNGNGTLDYFLIKTLFLFDYEFSRYTKTLDNFVPTFTQSEKEQPLDQIAKMEMLTSQVMLSRGDRTIPKIKYEPEIQQFGELEGPTDLFFDDLNNADSVAQNWELLSFGFEEKYWSLEDISNVEGDTNNVFLFGDFEVGYANNANSVAIPPAFDFSELDPNRGPAYLEFDVEVALEDVYDNFFVNVVSDGERLVTLADTYNGSIPNYGGYVTIRVDISQFAGLDDIEFWFVTNTDFSEVGGFGVLFDNVRVVVNDLLFYTSISDGEVLPLASQDIDVTILTEYLIPGDYELYTQVYTNGFESFYGSNVLTHITEFSARNVALEIDNPTLELGELARDQNQQFSFDATNVGAVDVDYLANVFIVSNETEEFIDDEFIAGKVAASARFKDSDKADLPTFNVSHHENLILEKFNSIDGIALQNSSVEHKAKSLTEDETEIYFEDFEGYTNNELGSPWQVLDESFGLGDIFNLYDYGTEEEPDYWLNVGDENENGFLILDNTNTTALSESIDLSGVPTDSSVIIEFTYSFLLEPGADVGSFWIGYETQSEPELLFIGSTEDLLINDGQFYRVTLDISALRGQSSVFLAFVVETDDFIQSAWAGINDISIYTEEAFGFISPNNGQIDSSLTQTFDVTILATDLAPGSYTAISVIDHYSNKDGLFINRVADQFTTFELANQKPIALNDTIPLLAGEVVDLDELFDFAFENDVDPDFPEESVEIYDFSDPIYGEMKYTIDGPIYVAPLNFDGWDYIEYIISDGDMTDTATVSLSIANQPHFPVGSDQQFVFLEDEQLTLSTIRMASGVGGQDPDVFVWASPLDQNVTIAEDAVEHTLTLSATSDFFGQTDAKFYVGNESGPTDSMMVSIIVSPVNDAPEAVFTSSIDGSLVTFTDLSSDALDMNAGGIVAWEWNFGDGNMSNDSSPVYDFLATGDFTVTLTVTDNGGLTDTFTENITILNVSNEELGGIPTKFSIEQNYPNPFNPSTNINYSIPEASKVSIVVYDMLGQKVAELVNAEQSAGNHAVLFDASNLSSGVYIYQLRAGSFTQTRKMTLIK